MKRMNVPVAAALVARGAPEQGVETSPLGIPRQQTEPLPIVPGQAWGDGTPTAGAPTGRPPLGARPQKLTVTRVAAACNARGNEITSPARV